MVYPQNLNFFLIVAVNWTVLGKSSGHPIFLINLYHAVVKNYFVLLTNTELRTCIHCFRSVLFFVSCGMITAKSKHILQYCTVTSSESIIFSATPWSHAPWLLLIWSVLNRVLEYYIKCLKLKKVLIKKNCISLSKRCGTDQRTVTAVSKTRGQW